MANLALVATLASRLKLGRRTQLCVPSEEKKLSKKLLLRPSGSPQQRGLSKQNLGDPHFGELSRDPGSGENAIVKLYVVLGSP